MSTQKKIIIIGAGLGGLAAAIRLAKRGHHVEIHEQKNRVGGKLYRFNWDGDQVDIGPSVLTMPYVIQELFKLCDKHINDYIQLERLDPAFHYYFKDGTKIQSHSNFKDLILELSEKSGIKEEKIRSYFKKQAKKAKLGKLYFLENPIQKISYYFELKTFFGAMQLLSMELHKTMSVANAKQLNNKYLEKIFNFYSSYIGSDPFKAPAVFNIISHFEMIDGVYKVKNGIYQLAIALERLAMEMGVKIKLNSKVDKVEIVKNKVRTIQLSNGDRVECDVLISNIDNRHFNRLIGKDDPDEKVLLKNSSNSVLIFLWKLDQKIEELNAHNFIFSNDLKKEFDSLFHDRKMDDDPTIYINTIASDNPNLLYSFVNVPVDHDQDWENTISRARKILHDQFQKVFGVDTNKIVTNERIFTPKDLAMEMSSFKGSIYGSNTNSLTSLFHRKPNFSYRYKNLYRVGGTVHPGPGIPLAILSAKIVDKLIK